MKKIALLVVLTIVVSLFVLDSKIIHAQGKTKIVIRVEDDKKAVQAGDTFTVNIEAQEAVDVFGLQFTFDYDPNMVQIVDNGIKFEKKMSIPGGKTEDFEKGILKYPIINTGSSKNKVDNMSIGSITFKALREGSVILSLSDIKVVNSDIREIHYNTQYKIALNIVDDKKADDKKDGDKKDNVVPVTPPKEISINPKDPDNTGDDRTPTSKGKTTVSDTPTPSIPSGGNNSTDNSSGNVDGESVPSSTSQQSSKYDPQALEEDSKESTDDSQAPDENSETSSADPQNSEEESMGNKEDEEKTKQSSEAKRGNTIRVLLYTFAVIILVLLVGCVSIYIINNKDKVKNSKIFKG